MKSILVLAPERPGVPQRERSRIDLQRTFPGHAALPRDACYSSVIVVNDGGVDTVRRLRLAIGLRERQRQLCIGVLTYLVQSPRAAGNGEPLPQLLQIQPGLQVQLDEHLLRLEYQAV